MNKFGYWRVIVVGAIGVFALVCGFAPGPDRIFFAKVRALGYPATREDVEASLTDIPFEENAAPVYGQAVATLKDLSPVKMARLPICGEADVPEPTEPIPEPTMGLMRAYLRRNASSLARLHSATRMRKCLFPMRFRLAFFAESRHLPILRAGARVLELESLYCASAGEPHRAAEAVLSLLRMSAALKGEPFARNQICRATLASMAWDALDQLVNRTACSESELVRLQEAFTNPLEPGFTGDGMARELAMDDYRLRVFMLEMLGELVPENVDIVRYYPMASAARRVAYWCGVRDAGRACSRRLVMRYIASSRSTYPEQKLEARRIEDTVDNMPFWYMAPYPLWLLDASRAAGADWLHIARMRTAEVALAIERFRLANDALPPNLGALVPECLAEIPTDPFSEQPLSFRKTECGYVVYSVGPDQEDDGGTVRKDWTEGDIVFTVERPGPRPLPDGQSESDNTVQLLSRIPGPEDGLLASSKSGA